MLVLSILRMDCHPLVQRRVTLKSITVAEVSVGGLMCRQYWTARFMPPCGVVNASSEMTSVLLGERTSWVPMISCWSLSND
jgi:hypothetical protein